MDIDLLQILTSLYALPLVFKLADSWLDDDSGALAARLFTGLGGISVAEAGFALWRLARIARDRPEVEKAVLARKPWPEIREELASLAGGGAFLEAWNSFLQEHGHHCRGELEFHNPRWAENPEYCLDMVRSYISCKGSADPDLYRQGLAEERRKAEETCRRRLKNPFKRWIFHRLVRRARRGCALRENFKDEAVRLVAIGRGILLELGRRLFEDGKLRAADDIFFLEQQEVLRLAEGSPPPDLHDRLRTRRAEYELFCSIQPPKVIAGRFDPADFAPDPVDASLTTLKGICASPGVATGKARVILKADNRQHLEPGEVLVAPFTDPGWTPYFLTAAAIVMDLGGILSHGSVIAREYGIPAVVNVGQGTRIIKTGQTIAVDADRGIVRILE